MSRPEKRKIAIFLHALAGGGAERAMANLANQFVEMGLETHLVLGRVEGPYLDQIDTRIKIFDLGSRRMSRALLPLNKYMRENRPDVLMSALIHTDQVALAGKILFRWPSRLFLSIQNNPSAGVASPIWVQRHWPLFVKTLYRFADGLIAISSGVADDVHRLMGRKGRPPPVIFNPVVTPGFFRQLEAEPSHPWFSNQEIPVVIAIGRLTRQKDYPTLLEAFALLAAKRPCRLLILGQGEDRAALADTIQRLGLEARVAMPGFVDNPYACLKRSRLFVLSSRWEGLANVVAEALACGTPVVSTDCPSGPAEILQNGKYGRLSPVGDVEALATAMDEALDAPVDKDFLIARGNDFCVAAIADRYIAALFPEKAG